MTPAVLAMRQALVRLPSTARLRAGARWAASGDVVGPESERWVPVGVDLLRCAPVDPPLGDLDVVLSAALGVRGAQAALEVADRVLAVGGHLLVRAPASALLGTPRTRSRGAWDRWGIPHTIVAVDGLHAVGWWTRGRWAGDGATRVVAVAGPG